jgi:integral membrane protein
MTTRDDHAAHDDLASRVRWLKALRGLGLAEGVTLVFLLGIAVPMKHLAGVPGLVSAAGPVHGLVFLLYLWLSLRVVLAEGWGWRGALRLCGVALLPCGTFFNDPFIKRRLREMTRQG